MSTAPKRTVVFIGKGLGPLGRQRLAHRRGDHDCLARIEHAGDVVALLRARLRGFRVKEPSKLDGVTLAEIDALAERCRNAKYGVVVWAPPALNFPHAELAVDQFTGLVKDLNQTIRFAGLVARRRRRRGDGGRGVHLDQRLSAPRQLCERCARLRSLPLVDRPDAGKTGEGDLLVWIASISPDLSPPETDLPTIVLGTPGLEARPSSPPCSFPSARPGVDHAGRLDPRRQRRVPAAQGPRRAPIFRASPMCSSAIEAAL